MRRSGSPTGVGPAWGPRRKPHRRLGQALPEFVLVLPVFLLILLGAIDFGRLFFSYIAVRDAASQGAAYAAASPTDSAGITTKVQQEANVQGQAGESTLSIATSCQDGSSGTAMSCSAATGGAGIGNLVTVNVSERFSFLTPLINNLFSNNFTLGASATASVLGLAAGPGATQPPGCTAPSLASFTYSLSGPYGINVDASASAPNSGQWAISSYAWDMGDGANPSPPITGKTASYTYATTGVGATYTITLTVQNQCGQATATHSVLIGPAGSPSPSPSASASASPSASPSPSPTPSCGMVANFNWTSSTKTVNFFGSFTGAPAPASWSWDFGDTTTGSGQNVAHTYSSNSARTVTLTIVNGACSATRTYSVQPGKDGP